MAFSDDIFKNISNGSKDAAEQLRKTVEQFKQLQNIAGKSGASSGIRPNAFSNMSASFGNANPLAHMTSFQKAVENMNASRSLHGSQNNIPTVPPSFRLPYNTAPLPMQNTMMGVPGIDSVLGNMSRGMSGELLYRRAVNMARNPNISAGDKAEGLQQIMARSGRLGGILPQERVERLTNNNLNSLQFAAGRQGMQSQYHSAMQERDSAKRLRMLEDLEKNAPIKHGREYEYIQRGIQRSRQAATDAPFLGSISKADSPSQLASLRESAMTSGVSNQLLDRIDKKLGKLNETAEKQQKREEREQKQFQQEHPILSKILPNRKAAGVASGFGAVAATLGRSVYELTGQQLQAPINTMFAQSEYEKAKQSRFLALGSDFTGEGRLKAAGNILLAGRSSAPFLGKGGFDRALAVAGMNTVQKGQRSILEDAIRVGAGGAMTLAGGAMALTGVGTLPGLAMMGAGSAMFGGGLSSAYSNNALRATGVLGSSLQAEGMAVRNSQTYGLASSLQQAEADRNLMYGKQIDSAESQYAANRDSIARMGSKAFTMNAMPYQGGGSTPFTLAEGLHYAKLDPAQREMYLNAKLATNLGKGNTSWDRATALGMDSAEYTSNISRTQYSLGVGGGGAEATGNSLIRMSRSGYGSMEQLLGNMSTLSGISGKGNSLSDLKAILGAAVSAGFDGSRLGQKFVETTAKVAGTLNLMDVGATGRNLGLMASNFGNGERGLAQAAAGLESFNKAATSNPLSNMLIDANLAFKGKLSDPTAYSLAHLNPTKQAEVVSQLSQIKRGTLSLGKASIEAQQYYYGAGGASAALQSTKAAMAASMPFLASRPELLQGARGLSGASLRKYLMSPSVEVNGNKESILGQIQKLSGFENAETAMAAFQAYGISEGVLSPKSGSAGTGAAGAYAANNITARAKAQFSNQLARSGMSMLGQSLADNIRSSGTGGSAIGQYVKDFARSGAPVSVGGALFQGTQDIDNAMKLIGKSNSELMAMSKGKEGGDAARALALKDSTVNQLAAQAQVESGESSSAQLVRLDSSSISALTMALSGSAKFTIDKNGRPVDK